ncbi:MAG: hypothetical protein N2035_06405, partial [Chthoniobacterales bacterium]|nr:hypothetical protein [Chthoniobacterales bacterium]
SLRLHGVEKNAGLWLWQRMAVLVKDTSLFNSIHGGCERRREDFVAGSTSRLESAAVTEGHSNFYSFL